MLQKFNIEAFKIPEEITTKLFDLEDKIAYYKQEYDKMRNEIAQEMLENEVDKVVNSVAEIRLCRPKGKSKISAKPAHIRIDKI